MKKAISTFVMFVLIALTVPMFASSASAQRRGRSYRHEGSYSQPYYSGYGNGYGYYGTYGRQSVYDRHRKAVNLTVGTGVGSVIGALIGGGKGALIGAAAGAVGGAVVTAKQAPRNYYRYRRY